MGVLATDKKDRKPTKLKEDTADVDSAGSRPSEVMLGIGEDKAVYINSIYDQDGYLVQLKFHKNDNIPRILIKLISFIVPFHPYLTTINIDSGLRCDGLHELSKVVSQYNITEVILDNTVILEANYYILINKDNSLKYLSLARCKLNDKAVESIASRLISSSLSILNLTSNRITDVGATYLGNVLRSNRKLTYLNLADNLITDEGAASILSCLREFPLSAEEITEMKTGHIAYLREKQEYVTKQMNSMFDSEKKLLKRRITQAKVASAPLKKPKGLERAVSVKNLLPSVATVNSTFLKKATHAAHASFGPFQNPFSPENTVNKDGVRYCLGNNSLCYLNLAYNNRSYFSVKTLYEVLKTQENLERTPKGLVNVCIEGNNIPETCHELVEIENILQRGLAYARRVSTAIKKKPVRLNTKIDLK